MSFKEALEKAKAKGRMKSDPVDVLVGDMVVSLVFTQVDGSVWSEVTAKHPAASGSLIAIKYGYEINSVLREIAPLSGARLEDGKEIPLVVRDATDDAPAVNEWEDLFSVLDGHSWARVADAVWFLNEWHPQLEIARLKKASAPASKGKRG